jgi:hypothetical protein
LYCQSEWYNIYIMFHVSYALIFGLKDEAYDEGIIFHVLFGCRDDGRTCSLLRRAALPGGVQPRSTPPRVLFFYISLSATYVKVFYGSGYYLVQCFGVTYDIRDTFYIVLVSVSPYNTSVHTTYSN